MKNYYKTLDIPASSTLPEIKKAYRELSKKYHPDLNPGNAVFEEKFKALQEAYSVLKDPYKRRIFDEKLETRRRARAINTTAVNNLKPPGYPPASNRDLGKGQAAKRKGKQKKLEKKDLYFAGGVILFLVVIVTSIFVLESKYYDHESNFDSIDTSYEQPFVDSLNLIRGYEPDTTKAEKKRKNLDSPTDGISPLN